MTYYDDDIFCFEIDENGHEVAKVKARQAMEKEGQEGQEMARLRDENEYFSREMRVLELNYINLLNKYKAIMEYVQPTELYPIFQKEFSQEHNTSREVAYRFI